MMWIRFILRFFFLAPFFCHALWQIRITICLYLLALRKAICLTHTQRLFAIHSTFFLLHWYGFGVFGWFVWPHVCECVYARLYTWNGKTSKHHLKNNKQKQSKMDNGSGEKTEKTGTTICYQLEHKFSHCDIFILFLFYFCVCVSLCWFVSFFNSQTYLDKKEGYKHFYYVILFATSDENHLSWSFL